MSSHSFPVIVRDQNVIVEFDTEKPEPDVGFYGGIDRSSIIIVDTKWQRQHNLEAILSAHEWDDIVEQLWWKFN